MSGRTTDETWLRTRLGLTRLVERLTPWLLDLGNWIFGAVVAFDLLVLAALLTVGPVDTAVLIATAAAASALPPAVAGFLLLRLADDMGKVDLERLATQAFEDVGFQITGGRRPVSGKAVEQRRARIVLRYSYLLLACTMLLTLVGVTAALWHMAWWVGALFVGTGVVSQIVFFVALSRTGADVTWTAPTGDAASKGE